MIDHLSLGVSDLAPASAFYDAVLAPLGNLRLWSTERGVGYGAPGSRDEPFAIHAAGKDARPPGKGWHLALRATSRAAVDQFHAAALQHGGVDEGRPGLRPQYGPGYYAGVRPRSRRLQDRSRVSRDVVMVNTRPSTTDRSNIGHSIAVACAGFARTVILVLAVVSCGRTDLYDTATSDAGATGELDTSVPSDSPADIAPDTPSLVPDSPAEVSDPCNATTCPAGCCDGDTCVKNISPDQCGASGQACVKCDPGDTCKGVCFHPQVNCGPTNCPGCCLGPNYCASGIADVQCGTGGQQCMRCIPSEGTGQCIAIDGGSGGTCTDQQCGPQTCLEGCCSNGVCVSGSSETACGTGGATCQTCGPGEFCHVDGCRPGTPCTPENCAGCCSVQDDGGICLPGTENIDCGNGGFWCTSCDTAHQACVNGSCTIPCSPATCHGCCDGNICAEGDQNFLCGTGGVACTNCEPQGQTCKAGACR